MVQPGTTTTYPRELIATAEQEGFNLQDLDRHVSCHLNKDHNILIISICPLSARSFFIDLDSFLSQQWEEEHVDLPFSEFVKEWEGFDWKTYALDHVDEWEVCDE